MCLLSLHTIYHGGRERWGRQATAIYVNKDDGNEKGSMVKITLLTEQHEVDGYDADDEDNADL